ncbi:MAG: SGNH/GDSL hydrolase family protein [Oceanipulchritudo sp.]
MIKKLSLVALASLPALAPAPLFSGELESLSTGMNIGNSAYPIKIVAIGDSITHGGSYNYPDEWTYRLPLQRILLENGISFDFIGTRTTGLNPDYLWPDPVAGIPFDPDHEAKYGAKTAVARDYLKTDLPQIEPPDVALIHLGTNDQKAHLDGGIGHEAAVVEP